MTNDPKIMGRWTNSRPLNILGWVTTCSIFAASLCLLVIWIK
jgi:Mn2+/Fe2+ NRAMP family transporter